MIPSDKIRINKRITFVNRYHPVNPVRNSSRCDLKPSGALNPVRDLSLNGINPPGIILKPNPAAAAGPEGLYPGGSSGALFLTG